jgi:hypothetical protein
VKVHTFILRGVDALDMNVGVRNEPQRFGVRVMLGFLRHPNLRSAPPRRSYSLMLYGGRPPEGPERKLSVSTRVESGSERFVTLGELLSLSQRKSPRPGRGKLEIHYRVWIEVTIIA